MIKTLMKSLVPACFCLSVIAPASAAPVMARRPAVQISGASDLVQIHQKRGYHRHHNHGYDNGHRGHRHKRSGYRHDNGFWLPPAAFTFGITIDQPRRGRYVRPGYTNPQHVSCYHSKYRSYDQRTNTFQPYNGPRRQCRSPYY